MESNQNIINKSGTMLAKRCEKCFLDITYKNWARHTMSKRHKINDPESTVVKKFERGGKSVKELRDFFRKIGVPGISKMGKKQLANVLKKGEFKVTVKRRSKQPSVFTKRRKINTIFPFHEELITDIKNLERNLLLFFLLT